MEGEEVAAAAVVVVIEAVARVRAATARGPRRRISSTCQSIWTSRLLSSSTAGAKVCFVPLFVPFPPFQPPLSHDSCGKGREGLCVGIMPLSIANIRGITTVTGTLKGYDALMNLVLDEVQEVMRGTCVCSFA